MNVIFHDDAFQNADILCITNLNQYVSTSDFDVALQNMVTIFCYPNYMSGQTASRMKTFSIFFHFQFFSTRDERKIIESLALSVQGFELPVSENKKNNYLYN